MQRKNRSKNWNANEFLLHNSGNEMERILSGFTRYVRLYCRQNSGSVKCRKGAAMKTLKNIVIGCAAFGMITGCTLVEVPVTGGEGTGYRYEDYDVDAYVAIPYEVRRLIADHVEGYSMPPVSRYGYEIYPVDLNDPFNLPSYVRSDFNGDGVDDYAYMFSSLSWDGADWFLDTKMLMVTSFSHGYVLSLELDLGTVTGSSAVPVEEYWGIRLLERGIHSVSEFHHGSVVEEGVELLDDGIYLASVNPEERSVFYADGNDVYEIAIDFGAVAKKRVGAEDPRAKRLIKLTTSTLKKDAVAQ